MKAGVTDLIMPDWFQHEAKNVMIFCDGFKHHGTSWVEQEELDPNLIHITTPRGGVYNIMVTADRKDACARLGPQPVAYIPSQPEASPQPFPPQWEMYKRVPQESWFKKGLRYADEGIKIFGTAKGLWEVGSALASGVRAAGPMLALL